MQFLYHIKKPEENINIKIAGSCGKSKKYTSFLLKNISLIYRTCMCFIETQSAY